MKDLKHHTSSAFLAGDDLIFIVPSFTLPRPLELVSRTTVGPFTAGLPVQVPLWLGLLLQQRHLCKIQTPEWMSVETLKLVLKKEQEEDSFSSELPFRYLEISRALLSNSTCTVDQGDAIRILIQDIASVRLDKIRRNLHQLSQQALSTTTTLPIIDVTGIGSMDLCLVQPFVTQAFGDHLFLSRSTNEQASSSGDKKDTSEAATDTTSAEGVAKARTSRLRRFR